MDEPNLIVPRQFAAEPLEVLERSTSLDLTPERPAVRKTMSQGLRRSTQCKYSLAPPDSFGKESGNFSRVSVCRKNAI